MYTKSEEIIANYFLENNDPVASKDLAEHLHISSATISRFVKKIGYVNYEVFIDAYKYEQKLADGTENITEIYQTHLDMLIENYKLLDEENISTLISKIEYFINRGYKVILADVAYANGGDVEFI